MILRFTTGDGEHFLNINFAKECYNIGFTQGSNYIAVTPRGYSDILAEMDFNCYGYSRSLETGAPEDWHDFITNELNGICLDCPHYLNGICTGTKTKFYDNCLWKDKPAENLRVYLSHTQGRGAPI